MRQWLIRQLSTVAGTTPVVVLDPHRIVRTDEINAAVRPDDAVVTDDWFSLRQAWERHGRHPTGTRVAIHVLDHIHHAADLPWDIAQCATVRRVRPPSDSAVRELVLSVADEDSDKVMEALSTDPTATGRGLVAVLADVSRDEIAHRGGQVKAALRLHRQAQPAPVMVYAREHLGGDPVIDSVLATIPDLRPLRTLWDEWLATPHDPELSLLFDMCRAEMSDLFLDGTLQPKLAATTDIPSWARLGTREASPAERLESLMSQQPAIPSSTTNVEPWLSVASWWGSVRNELAQVNPPVDELTASTWETWTSIDTEFLAWIGHSYGSQLMRSWANGPKGLHQVQPYLANQVGSSGRALLLVFDGMSHALWTQICSASRMDVLHSSGTLAMLPSLTEISRQAIAAGQLPMDFPDTLFTLRQEDARWAAAWAPHGRSNTWLRVDGELNELPAIPLGHYDAIGLVISATDKQMHAAKLMGDVGLHAGLQTWLRSGFLDQLLQAASEHGYDVWVTTDHGGIECLPEPGVNEGEYVKRQGTRHRRYANRTLRDAANADGIVLNPIPGLPREYGDCVLFAPGRISWRNARISHGGLSFDEVVVPFAKVVAA